MIGALAFYTGSVTALLEYFYSNSMSCYRCLGIHSISILMINVLYISSNFNAKKVKMIIIDKFPITHITALRKTITYSNRAFRLLDCCTVKRSKLCMPFTFFLTVKFKTPYMSALYSSTHLLFDSPHQLHPSVMLHILCDVHYDWHNANVIELKH